jgi:hypothetical protein
LLEEFHSLGPEFLASCTKMTRRNNRGSKYWRHSKNQKIKKLERQNARMPKLINEAKLVKEKEAITIQNIPKNLDYYYLTI